MKTLRSGLTVGCTALGLVLLVACSADTSTMENETTASDEELRRGGRSGPSHARRGHGRHHHGHRHHHGPHCGHGKNCGHGKGGSGNGGSGGTSTGKGGSGAASMGGTGGGSAGSAGSAGTGGSGTGGSPDPGVCGDGVPSYFEQCEDGNTAAGDGCNAACEIEPGFTCNFDSGCREVVCGDSLQDFYAVGGGVFEFEVCDDGNQTAGDGCNSECDLEVGFVCPEPGVPCRAVVCGDGFQDSYSIPGEGGSGGTAGTGGASGSGTGGFPTGGSAGAGGGTLVFEECDDGNTTPGDGCDATCAVEEGFICDRPGVPCREPRCGDGSIDFIPGGGGSGGTGSGGFAGTAGTASGGSAGTSGTFEECDDGNEAASDGCSASCVIEPGFACPDPGLPCHAIVCGDGIEDWPDEECDDGNTIPNDGCTSCTWDADPGTGGTGGFGGTSGTGPIAGGVGGGG